MRTTPQLCNQTNWISTMLKPFLQTWGGVAVKSLKSNIRASLFHFFADGFHLKCIDGKTANMLITSLRRRRGKSKKSFLAKFSSNNKHDVFCNIPCRHPWTNPKRRFNEEETKRSGWKRQNASKVLQNGNNTNINKRTVNETKSMMPPWIQF